MTSVQANEKEREADSQKIKDAVSPLLQFQPEAGGGSVAEVKGTCSSHVVKGYRTMFEFDTILIHTESDQDVFCGIYQMRQL